MTELPCVLTRTASRQHCATQTSSDYECNNDQHFPNFR